ncbi:MAG: hypothetical protein ACK5QW_01880 [Cyanobacteriota bacterium]|jgi:hypothetical protein
MVPPSRSVLEADLRRLSLQTLAGCWLLQALLAVVCHQWLPIPVRPLVIDRGGCGDAAWRELLERYGDLHRRHHLGWERFSPVIETSVFGVRLSTGPPDPQRLAAIPPVGVPALARLGALRARHPNAVVLSCPKADLVQP